MSSTQSKRIRSILLDAIKNYNASINLDTSGRAYSEIVTPVYDALTPDMFEASVEDYLVAAIKEQYPSLDLQDGDLIMDLLVRPLQVLLEPMKREINSIRKRQSIRYATSMTIEDAEDLAANFFVTRKTGSVAAGYVRILVTNPTYITVNSGVRFSTADNVGFIPARQEFIPAAVVAGQRQGNNYYADVRIIAEEVGAEYNVEANTIVRVEGLPAFAQVTNPEALAAGENEETKEELLRRVEVSLTERSLTSRIGINARLANDFTDLDHVQVIGFGDPEMERDILVGEGTGHLIASGVSLLFGRYVFMLTGYEDADNGNKLPKAGDKVKLSFWKFIYGSTAVEESEIQDVVYTSYGDAKDSPTVHIFLLKNAPTTVMEPTGAVPGILPGVFTSIFTDPTITISGVPGGIYNEGVGLPTELASNEVHIGGKYDVWVMPSETETDTTTFTVHKTPDVIKEIKVSFDGEPSTLLSGTYASNRISFSDYIITTSAPLPTRVTVTGDDNKSTAFVKSAVPDETNTYVLTCRSGVFSESETLTVSGTGDQADITSIAFTHPPKADVGSVLTVSLSSSEIVSYFVVTTEENYYVVDKELEDELTDLNAYVHKETGLDNILDPKLVIFPSLSEYSTGLQTYIGRSDVYVQQDLLGAGVNSNDSLEILSGADRGIFTITEINQHSANVCRLEITPTPNKTNSGLRFRIIRSTDAVSAPFVSMLQEGVVVQTDNGSRTVPYAKSVGAYALGAFSGTVNKSRGFNGFVLPNLGPAFKGTGASASDIAKQPDASILAQFTNTKFDDCITEGCTICDGIPVVIVVTIDGQTGSYSSVKTYIEGLTSTQATSYLTSLKTWMHSIVESFFRGTNSTSTTTADDLDAFIDMFAPFTFGQPTSPSENIISRVEMCVPTEVFDGSNNVYMALPEIDWDTAFESVSTFEQAIVDFLSGDLFKDQPALSLATPGDAIKVEAGANKGEYVIDKVINFPMYSDSSIQTEVIQGSRQTPTSYAYSINDARVFNFTVVIIKGEFPEEVLKGSSDYFLASIPSVTSILPVAPAFPNSIEVRSVAGANAGSIVNPFSVVEDVYTTTFKALFAQGFDLPDEFSLDPGPTLTKVVKRFFSEYNTGKRSPQQTVRMLFQDPIDVTVYSPKVRKELTWKPEVLDSPISRAQNAISLPRTGLGGTTISAQFTRNLDQESTTLSGTLPSSIDTVTDIEEFVASLQASLDPSYSSVIVKYENHPSETGFYYIVVEALFGGQGSYLYPKAESPTESFYLLGYTSSGVTKQYLEVGVSAEIVANGDQFNILHFPDSVAETQLFIGASIPDMWVFQTYSTLVYTLNKPVNTSVSISVTLDGGSVLSLTGTVVANMNQSGKGALLVHLIDSSDSVLRGQLTEDVASISFTTASDGVTSVVSYPSSVLASSVIHSVDDEEFAVCFGNLGRSDSSLFPITRGLTGYFDTESVGLVWDTANGSVVVGSNSYIIDGASLELTIRVEHVAVDSTPTISLTLPPTSLNVTALATQEKHDLYSILFAQDSVALQGGTTTMQVTSEFTSKTTPLSVTVGSSSTNILTDTTAQELLEFEAGIQAATTQLDVKTRICSLLNSKMGSSPIGVFAPLVGNYIELLPLTNTTASIGIVGTHPVSSGGLSYGFSLLDYTSFMTSSGEPSLRATSYGVSSTVVGQNGSVQGVSTPSALSTTREILPHNGTRFSLTQRGEERQLVADIQDNESYYYGVYPRKHANLEIEIEDLPRNSVITAHYTNAEACTLFLGGSESALSLGVQTGDYVYMHEHREILDNSNMSQTPFSPKKDRVLHVVHDDAKRQITVLSSAGTFLNPETLNVSNNQTPGSNAVKEGDIVFFEDLSEYAVVTTVKNTVATLSKSVTGTPKEKIIRYGDDGRLEDDAFVSTSYMFTAADVGKYLVIYAAEGEEVDGSYVIDSVNLAGVATLGTSTGISEANLHWVVVKAGVVTPGSSSIFGRTSTLGVTPVRIYSGTPSIFKVGNVSSDINADRSKVELLYGNSVLGPKRGVNQPFKILRSSECRIAASEMATQGTESSLYYFDVPATTLTPTFDLNIKENTQCTPVFYSYKSAGYYFTVKNKSTVFSSREDTKLHITSAILSQETSGSLTDVTIVEASDVSASYYTSSTISRVQSLVSASANKSITADPLVRHFLPSYTYINFNVLRGDTTDATESVIDYINDLQPTEELRLSSVEKMLHAYELDLYNHPTFMYCLTTDLDRNVILTRSDNFVDDTTIQHNGTNRITNFIATESTISLEGE